MSVIVRMRLGPIETRRPVRRGPGIEALRAVRRVPGCSNAAMVASQRDRCRWLVEEWDSVEACSAALDQNKALRQTLEFAGFKSGPDDLFMIETAEPIRIEDAIAPREQLLCGTIADARVG